MNKKYILPGAFAVLMMASCADEFDPQFEAEQPANLAKIAELAEYAPLKEYINRDAHPTMKLGAALDAAEFNKKLTVYNVGVTNFDEVVAGNAMKYASCIDDKGIMDFGTVNTFVNNAEKAGITVYGHTLAWHAQQRPKYLNTLIADRVVEVEGDGETVIVEKELFSMDYSTASAYTFWHSDFAENDYNIELADGGLKISNYSEKEQNYFVQYHVGDGFSTKAGGKFKMLLKMWASGDGFIASGIGGWGGRAEKQIDFVAGDNDLVINYANGLEGAAHIMFQTGKFVGDIVIKSVVVYSIEEEKVSANPVIMEKYWDNIIPNSDMEGDDASAFVKKENNGALERTITDGVGKNGSRGVQVVSNAGAAEDWDTQFWIALPEGQWLEEGARMRVTFDYKASMSASGDTQSHGAPGDYAHWACVGSPNFTTEWQTYQNTVTVDGSMASKGGLGSIAFNLSKDRGNQVIYYFDNILVEIEKERPAKITVNYVDNSDMEGDDAHNFVTNDPKNGMRRVITDGVGRDGSRGVTVTSPAGASQDWDTQFWIAINDDMWLQEGDEVTVQFDYKASIPASADTQSHGAPGDYAHWACVGSPNFTTEWQTYTYNLKVDGSMASKGGLGSIAFNLAKDKANEVTFYFDNVRIFAEKEQDVPKNTIPLTPEEKHDTLVWAMEQWIAGMMDACEGKVKAWDVVNEAISGGGDVDGKYALQHGTEDNTTDFFWQDYLGDEDYVRQAVRLARKYYAKSLEDQELSDDGKLKLFINDYNLESDWDQNGKLKSLIAWINVWESDGVTKIDGIGSQMHISYYEDAKTLESKKAAIVNSFKLMAATGKLVRISELDMGYVDASGKSLDKTEMDDAKEKVMADYYAWIIEQYYLNVPENQQYGITQWCLTDADGKVGDKSGWRPGEPVGIWDSNWYRKYVYVGWTEGLAK